MLFRRIGYYNSKLEFRSFRNRLNRFLVGTYVKGIIIVKEIMSGETGVVFLSEEESISLRINGGH